MEPGSISSENIYCDNCSHKDHKDGRTTYYHSAITPVIVKPGSDKVISLEPEFIQPQDGYKKQDCENAAGKRWLSTYGLQYAPLGVTILGDDLILQATDREAASCAELQFHINM